MEQNVYNHILDNHFQAMLESEEFLNEISNWLSLLGDKRLLVLRHLIYEIDLSETEQLKEALYEYGSYLTEKNYFGRRLFTLIATLIRQIESGNCIGIE